MFYEDHVTDIVNVKDERILKQYIIKYVIKVAFCLSFSQDTRPCYAMLSYYQRISLLTKNKHFLNPNAMFLFYRDITILIHSIQLS